MDLVLRWVATAAVAAATVGVATAQTYTLIDLGSLDKDMLPYSINNNTQIVGVGWNFGNKGWIWQAGELTPLPGLGGPAHWGTGINSAGVICGFGQIQNSQYGHGYVNDHGVMTDMQTMFGQGDCVAKSINDLGQIVGYSWSAPGMPGSTRAFLWQNGTYTNLGTLGDSSDANAINNIGEIVGKSRPHNINFDHAFLWRKGVMYDLGALNGLEGNITSEAFDINSHSIIVGTSSSNFGMRGFRWEAGMMHDMGFIEEGASPGPAFAYGINENGQIVGTTNRINGPGSAFVWNGVQARDLNLLIPADTGWTLRKATAVNDKGEIVGYGYIQGSTIGRAFLLRPTRHLSGHVTLQNYSGTAVPKQYVTVEIRETATGAPLEIQTPDLDANGNFTISTNLPVGTYSVAVKGTHWLRKILPSVDFSDTGATGLEFSLVNGDINGDNAVTLNDFALLRSSFGASPGDGFWNDMADLNGDGSVTLGDFAILRSRFGTQGEE